MNGTHCSRARSRQFQVYMVLNRRAILRLPESFKCLTDIWRISYLFSWAD